MSTHNSTRILFVAPKWNESCAPKQLHSLFFAILDNTRRSNAEVCARLQSTRGRCSMYVLKTNDTQDQSHKRTNVRSIGYGLGFGTMSRTQFSVMALRITIIKIIHFVPVSVPFRFVFHQSFTHYSTMAKRKYWSRSHFFGVRKYDFRSAAPFPLCATA